MSDELTVTFIYSPVGASKTKVCCMTEPVRDGWATWNVETNSTLISIRLSDDNAILEELWIGLDQQLVNPIPGKAMLDIPLCTYVTAIRPGCVVRAKVVKDV